MYNGIGLTTVRGTGTSGYVQTNRAAVRRRQPPPRRPRSGRPRARAAPAALVEHEARRRVEVAVAELEDDLTERGYDAPTVTDMTEQLRSDLLARSAEERTAAADRELDWRGRGRPQALPAPDLMERRDQRLRQVLRIKPKENKDKENDKEKEEKYNDKDNDNDENEKGKQVVLVDSNRSKSTPHEETKPNQNESNLGPTPSDESSPPSPIPSDPPSPIALQSSDSQPSSLKLPAAKDTQSSPAIADSTTDRQVDAKLPPRKQPVPSVVSTEPKAQIAAPSPDVRRKSVSTVSSRSVSRHPSKGHRSRTRSPSPLSSHSSSPSDSTSSSSSESPPPRRSRSSRYRRSPSVSSSSSSSSSCTYDSEESLDTPPRQRKHRTRHTRRRSPSPVSSSSSSSSFTHSPPRRRHNNRRRAGKLRRRKRSNSSSSDGSDWSDSSGSQYRLRPRKTRRRVHGERKRRRVASRSFSPNLRPVRKYHDNESASQSHYESPW